MLYFSLYCFLIDPHQRTLSWRGVSKRALNFLLLWTFGKNCLPQFTISELSYNEFDFILNHHNCKEFDLVAQWQETLATNFLSFGGGKGTASNASKLYPGSQKLVNFLCFLDSIINLKSQQMSKMTCLTLPLGSQKLMSFIYGIILIIFL